MGGIWRARKRAELSRHLGSCLCTRGDVAPSTSKAWLRPAYTDTAGVDSAALGWRPWEREQRLMQKKKVAEALRGSAGPPLRTSFQI